MRFNGHLFGIPILPEDQALLQALREYESLVLSAADPKVVELALKKVRILFLNSKSKEVHDRKQALRQAMFEKDGRKA